MDAAAIEAIAARHPEAFRISTWKRYSAALAILACILYSLYCFWFFSVGAVLEKAMAQAGMERDSIYLTNAVKHFKWELRGKRRLHKTPAQKEISACHLWLEEELARVRPDVVVALGSTALKSVLQDGSVTMKSVMDAPVQHDGRWVVTVYHPSYVLRAPDEATRRQAYEVIVEGLRQARKLLGD